MPANTARLHRRLRELRQIVGGAGVVLDANRCLGRLERIAMYVNRFARRSRACPAKTVSASSQSTQRARSGGAIFCFHLHTDAAQEIRGQHAAGVDDHRLVCVACAPAPFARSPRASAAICSTFELSMTSRLPPRAAASTRSRFEPWRVRNHRRGREHDTGGPQLRNAGCRLERAIPSPDHQHVLTAVLLWIDQAVSTLGSSSPGTPSLRGVPRRPTASSTLRVRYCARGVRTMKPSPSRSIASTRSR